MFKRMYTKYFNFKKWLKLNKIQFNLKNNLYYIFWYDS